MNAPAKPRNPWYYVSIALALACWWQWQDKRDETARLWEMVQRVEGQRDACQEGRQ